MGRSVMCRVGRPRPVRGSAPAMARERAEPRFIGVGWGCDFTTVMVQYHLMPAPRDRAMVARSDRATVKRARFAFTAPPRCSRASCDRVSGSRAVFRGRSLALRPRLAMGLPWTVVHRGANFASCPNLCGPSVTAGHMPEVLVEPTPVGSVRGRTAPADRSGRLALDDAAVARVVSGPRPCIAATTAIAAPTPMSTSPMLNTFAAGTQVGIANRSVSGPSTTPSTRRLFE